MRAACAWSPRICRKRLRLSAACTVRTTSRFSKAIAGLTRFSRHIPVRVNRLVSLRYSAPVKIDAGRFENLLLFMTCVDGSAKAMQGRSTVHWQKGETLPLSPNLPSQLMFDRRFWQKSIRLDKAFVEDFCSRLLNRPIDRPIRFELTPFSQPLELAWQQAIKTIQFVQSVDLVQSSATLQRLEEFMAALILESHPHNYSELLRNERTSAEPRIVREAERLMQSAGPNISISEVAKELRVSLRSLELGFRDARNMTPTQVHRQFRLQSARQALLHPTQSTTVTSVAMTFGFAASCALQPLLPIDVQRSSKSHAATEQGDSHG